MSSDLVPADGAAIATELAEIESEVADRGSRYWRGVQAPARQARYLQLLKAQEGGQEAPKHDPHADERLALEVLIANKGSKYWRGPEAEALQRRYLQILEGGTSPDSAAGDAWRASPAAARASLDPTLIQEWGPQFDASLRRAQDVAAQVVGALPDREAQMALTGAFDGLAAPVQSAIFRELAQPEPGFTKPADDNDMAVFELACAGGGAAVNETWGSQARRRVGIALDRFIQVERSLTDGALNQFAHFWKTRSSRERQLMLHALGS